MTDSDFFAMVRRDELWVHGALSEDRLSHGQAVTRGHEIIASDTIEDRTLRKVLFDAADTEMERLRGVIASMGDARVRGVVTALMGNVESTITITIAGISVVSSPDYAERDYAALKRLIAPPAAPPPARPLPVVWRNGSAAVLLHEAIGHAAEHGHTPIRWPKWLLAVDQSSDGRSADLIAGELPIAFRRESFRNVPLRRMTNLLIDHQNAPFELPPERVEVHLVTGGTYEPLTEMVTMEIAIADLVAPKAVRRVPPFALRASRSAIASAVVGARGTPLRYPGVICSREGQELFVASNAPVMITAGLA